MLICWQFGSRAVRRGGSGGRGSSFPWFNPAALHVNWNGTFSVQTVFRTLNLYKPFHGNIWMKSSTFSSATRLPPIQYHELKMSQTNCKSRLTKIWQRTCHRWSSTISLNFLFTDLGPSPVSPIMRCLFIEQSKTFTIPVEIKTGKLFFLQIHNINCKDSTWKTLTFLSWYKMRRENNQPTRINLLINFNSSREEPGSFISSVRGDQGSIWLEICWLMLSSSINFT